MNHELIAPAVALFGTLLVAAIGFYQWRSQNANPNRAANATARREAYEGLWKRLEEINLDLRKTRENFPSLKDQLSSINEYFIAHSLYFEDADQVIIGKYVRALHRVRSIVDKSDGADLKDDYYLTGAFSLAPLKELQEAAQEMEKYRSIIKEKAQKIAASV